MQVTLFECRNDKNKVAVTPDATGANLPANFCQWDMVKTFQLNP